jgi:hypothetical protein
MTMEVVKCDVCGKVKEEGNKWIHAMADISRTCIAFGYMPGYMPLDTMENVKLDLCGNACVQKILGEILANLRM